MNRKFAFTTAAMAAALEDTPVSYEDLAEIEKDFDEAETEISMCSFSLSLVLLNCLVHYAESYYHIQYFGLLALTSAHLFTCTILYIQQTRMSLTIC